MYPTTLAPSTVTRLPAQRQPEPDKRLVGVLYDLADSSRSGDLLKACAWVGNDDLKEIMSSIDAVLRDRAIADDEATHEEGLCDDLCTVPAHDTDRYGLTPEGLAALSAGSFGVAAFTEIA